MTDKHFTKFLQNISKELKGAKPTIPESVEPIAIEPIVEETTAERIAKHLSRSQKREDSIPTKSVDMVQTSIERPVISENIEAQRWNDPLRREPTEKFVTFKEMNDHYSLFLNRIQQQMSSIGGGGEVKFARLDDVSTLGATGNKFLTYNQSTKKFVFDTIPIATETSLGGIIPGPGFTIGETGILGLNAGPSFYLEDDVFKLRAGTEEQIGGVKSGNGIVIASDGTINLDTEGLSFVFGDFFASTPEVSGSNVASLSSVNLNQEIVIASNGDGGINVIGQFEVYATNGNIAGALSEEPFFRVQEDGQVRILVPLADTTEGGVEIIGSELGTSLQPGIAGTMLHLTGNAGESTRVYHDTLSDYGSYVFRRYNGSVITPTAVLANEDIGRINFTAASSSGMGNIATSQIRVTALENQTPTAQGSKITFTVTPLGSPVSSRVDVATISVADGVSATKFTGPLTGNVTGNASGTAGSVAAANVTGTTLASNVVTSSLTTVGTLTNLTVTNTISGSINGNANTATTATNLAAATGILAGSLSINPPNTGKNASVIGTYTITGLTTSHKIVIMPQAALPDNFNIAGAWASATNTLSVNFQTYGGGIDAPAVTVAYFAWV